MKTKSNILKVALVVALFVGMNAVSAFAGSTGSMAVLQTAEQAKAVPVKATVMMACGGCKTITPVDQKGILAWFSTKVQHDCPSCGGKVTFRGEKTGGGTTYTHTCSMCGNASAYVCASH